MNKQNDLVINYNELIESGSSLISQAEKKLYSSVLRETSGWTENSRLTTGRHITYNIYTCYVYSYGDDFVYSLTIYYRNIILSRKFDDVK